MTCPGEGILTDLTRRLVDKTKKEVNYFRHFETHDREFGQDEQLLIRKLEKVQKDIEDAKRNNHYQIEGEVQDWIKEANNIIQNNAEIRRSRLDGWHPLRQYRQGKMLAQRTPAIKTHIEKCNFDRLARAAELPGIKYHASRDFIDFGSRKTKLKQLVEALKDGKHYMIGLQGMGGTGKTTLSTQVGKQLEESKVFEKVIFVVVSTPPDLNKIRADIAGELGLKLEERDEADHSKLLWARISKNDKKLLIILDDVWGKLNLTEIGIPSGLDHKNCYVLITTRNSNVCHEMRCQPIVRLHTLDGDDALRLFMFHARSDNDDSSGNELEGLAPDFLKECGGLPVAIVALASTLRNWHVGELNEALRALQKSKLLVDLHEGLLEVYSCLRLSYDNLHNEKAENLFILCSIFPEDYEFPVDLIIRLGIGLGIFGEADDYCAARRQALTVKNKLIDSSLLQKVGKKECVKMHDLVREAAQLIAKENVQVIMMNSTTPLKPNTRFLFWSVGDFPDQFDGTKLEILLLWISGNVPIKDPNGFFAGMTELKILFLHGEYVRELPSPSLLKSLLSLKYIQTLILDGWELGDISILKNIQSLVTLEFKNCIIIELHRNIMELKKLRWLGLRWCEIQRKNPFEVIKRCSQLEELYFVENDGVKDWNREDDKEIEDEIAQDISPSELQMFSIACDGFRLFAGDDNGLLRCFKSENIQHIIPDVVFKYLVRSAEILELGKIGQTSWKNVAPDIIPLENGGRDNLIKLYLYAWDDIESLVDNSNYHHSNSTFFSKLVELHLDSVGVKELYRGAVPSRFLWQLQILKLENCLKLQNIDENIKLPYLKVLILIGCPMFQPSIFKPSSAQSLQQLEELHVEDCGGLKRLIACESSQQETIVAGSQKNHGLLFPELKSLRIVQCGELEMAFPVLLRGDLHKLNGLYIRDCQKLKYIVGEYRDVGQVLQGEILPSLTEARLSDVPSFISLVQNCRKYILRSPQDLTEHSKDKHDNSRKRALSWPYRCCFVVPTKDTNIGVSNAIMEHHTITQGSCGTSRRMETAACLIRHPSNLQNIRHMTLCNCSKSKSLFSVSIATTIMLEELKIICCEELKDIITNQAEDDDRLNRTSVFPNLQSLTVAFCNKLEFVFPSTLSGGLQKLKSIEIMKADDLKYVFGRYDDEECVSNENENNEPHVHLPALESLSLSNVRNMISIGIKKYQQKCPSVRSVEDPEEIKRHMQDVVSERAKESELQGIVNVPKLKCLTIENAAELKSIFGNESDELHIHLPATLETLSFVGVPKIMNKILAKQYRLSFQSLQSIQLEGLQEFNGRSFLDLVACLQDMQLNVKGPKDLMKIIKDVQKLTSLEVRDSKIKEVLNLEGVEINCTVLTLSLEKLSLEDLSELSHICKDPKYILSLPNLRYLRIEACKKLRVIFSVSIVKSLPQLSSLNIADCDELVDIIEESVEGHLHQTCFPKLEKVWIRRCNSLKCLFSISTCGMFPKLWTLTVQEASELEQVFVHKQDDMQKMAIMKDVFPNLSYVTLKKLPRLLTICEGIDFQGFKRCEVYECPKYQGPNHIRKWPQNWDSENQAATNDLPNFAESSKEAMKTNVEEIVSLMSKEEKGKEIEAKDATLELEEQASKTSTADELQLRGSPLQGLERGKEVVRIVTASTSTATSSNSKSSETEKEAVGMLVTSGLSMATTSSKLESSKEIEKEAVKVPPSHQSVAPTPTNSEVTQSIKDTMEQGLKKNYEGDDDMITVASTNSDLRKQSTRPIDNLSGKNSSLTIKETGDHPSVQEESDPDKPTKAATNSDSRKQFAGPIRLVTKAGDSSVEEEHKLENPTKLPSLPNVIPSLHHQAQNADAGPSSISRICEVFQFVQLNDVEITLLAQALKQYPQLLLSHEHLTNRIIGFSYRVLVDILVMLATKTPCTITSKEKSTLEANLCEAAFVGFDENWIDSVRARVLGADISDVLAMAEEEIQVMEAELETCDIALEQVRKQRVETKERLAMTRRQMEKAQTEFEAIDSQMSCLLEDRKKLICRITEFREIINAKDRPFGI